MRVLSLLFYNTLFLNVDGSWKILINNTKEDEGSRTSLAAPFPSDGEFVVGQAPRMKFLFNTKYAFVGDIAHLNLWNEVLDDQTMRSIFSSCIFMYCGNGVQWADLRSGTRGPMRMRWPSTVVCEYKSVSDASPIDILFINLSLIETDHTDNENKILCKINDGV